MKKNNIITILALVLVISFSSCKKYLDINKNPNEATYANPELVLPGALTSTASLLVTTYNDYGAFVGGYQANAYGFSYVGSDAVTYNYTASSYNGLWTSVFANLRNYQTVIDGSNEKEDYQLFAAVARIMKSFNYQLLVDNYGDVPYSDALKGVEALTPKYDKAEDVYKASVLELDAAIAILKANLGNTSVKKLGTHDVMFKGDLTKWIQFANSVKLRFLIRAQNSSISAFVNTAFGTFTSEGFLTEDAVVNPGYSASSANMNPQWTSVHSSYSGSVSSTGRSRVPTFYVMGFYDGKKLSDPKRGKLMYRDLTKPLNQLGIEPTSAAAGAPTANYPAWYVGIGTGTGAAETQGVFKSRVASTPIMLAAEVNFLLAEAALKGHVLSGTAKDNFDKGVENSFIYLNKFGSTNSFPKEVTMATIQADIAAYKAANAGVNAYLVDYSLATTDAQKLEAIITQKYIALNYIHSHEGWNEYRRTSFPKNDINATSPENSFASVTSMSTRADKLPVRLLHPQSEINLNGENVPKGLNPFNDLIFWDAN